MFKKIKNREKQYILLMSSNEEKCEGKSERRWHYLAVKNIIIKRNKTSWGFLLSELPLFFCSKKKNFDCIKKYVKIKTFVMSLCLLKILKYKNLINIKNVIKHHILFIQILNV